MKILKITFPLLIVSILAIYARQYYNLLPPSLSNALHYFPPLLIIFATAITLHFNQIRILSNLIVISALYILLSYDILTDFFTYTLFATFTPLLLLVTILMKQQSVFTIRALPFYLIFIVVTLFSLWLIREQTEWATYYLSSQWLPAQYFDWTQIPQTSLIIFLITFISLIALVSIRQDHLTLTGLAVLILVWIGLHFRSQGSDLIILTSAGLILCLINVLQESWRMAYLDELTQLPSRRAMREKLQSLLGIYTLAMVDIDFFKKFNDSYGHETGDDALRMIAAKLQNVTGGGSVYRYGGEEFTIVFSNKSVDQVKEHLETLRQNIADSPFVVNRRSKQTKNKSVKITVSIGVADSIGINTAEETLEKADKALYKAKKKGRNCIAI
jgi:diguanylate cyclase (GGDEF)-like protein